MADQRGDDVGGQRRPALGLDQIVLRGGVIGIDGDLADAGNRAQCAADRRFRRGRGEPQHQRAGAFLQSVGAQQPAVEQDHDARGDLLDLRQDVRGDQHGMRAGERADQIAHGDDLMRIEPAGRLVEHQHLRIAEERGRDRHTLAKAARQLAGRQAHDARKIEPLGGRFHRLLLGGAAHSLDARHEMQELGHVHMVVERRIFRHVADGLAHGERIRHHVVAGDLDPA